MKIAFLGCGYVANMYRLTLKSHPAIELVGVYDLERSRTEVMAQLTGAKAYSSFSELLNDQRTKIVLNLTNPVAHFETTSALLEAGKHVYSEKPLALKFEQAHQLVDLAKSKELLLVSAPCTLFNRVAQTLWNAIRDELVGPIRLVYAEMEDGMVHRAPVQKWINEAGIAWPATDEFTTGCTIEHAGYVLTWLCAMFGPVKRLTAQSAVLAKTKSSDIWIPEVPDFSVSVIEFQSGTIARMTNGIYASHNHRMFLYGDKGVLTVDDPRNDNSTIRSQFYRTWRRRRFLWPIARRLALKGDNEQIPHYKGSQTWDFIRAIADMEQLLALS